MTKLLERAMTKARALPPDMQDEIAHLVLIYAGEEDRRPVIPLSPEEDADLAEADAEVARGEFASDEEVAQMLARFQP